MRYSSVVACLVLSSWPESCALRHAPAPPRVATSHGLGHDEIEAVVTAALEHSGQYYAAQSASLGHARCVLFEGVPPQDELLDAVATSLDDVDCGPVLILGDANTWASFDDVPARCASAVEDHVATYGLRVPLAVRETAWSPESCRVVENSARDGVDTVGLQRPCHSTSNMS